RRARASNTPQVTRPGRSVSHPAGASLLAPNAMRVSSQEAGRSSTVSARISYPTTASSRVILGDQTTMTTLPATLRLGPVHLTVRDLDRAVAWYQRSLGLRVHRH